MASDSFLVPLIHEDGEDGYLSLRPSVDEHVSSLFDNLADMNKHWSAERTAAFNSALRRHGKRNPQNLVDLTKGLDLGQVADRIAALERIRRFVPDLYPTENQEAYQWEPTARRWTVIKRAEHVKRPTDSLIDPVPFQYRVSRLEAANIDFVKETPMYKNAPDYKKPAYNAPWNTNLHGLHHTSESALKAWLRDLMTGMASYSAPSLQSELAVLAPVTWDKDQVNQFIEETGGGDSRIFDHLSPQRLRYPIADMDDSDNAPISSATTVQTTADMTSPDTNQAQSSNAPITSSDSKSGLSSRKPRSNWGHYYGTTKAAKLMAKYSRNKERRYLLSFRPRLSASSPVKSEQLQNFVTAQRHANSDKNELDRARRKLLQVFETGQISTSDRPHPPQPVPKFDLSEAYQAPHDQSPTPILSQNASFLPSTQISPKSEEDDVILFPDDDDEPPKAIASASYEEKPLLHKPAKSGKKREPPTNANWLYDQLCSYSRAVEWKKRLRQIDQELDEEEAMLREYLPHLFAAQEDQEEDPNDDSSSPADVASIDDFDGDLSSDDDLLPSKDASTYVSSNGGGEEL